MKKISMFMIALVIGFMMAAPALAYEAGDLKIDGEYRARGFSHSEIDLNSDVGASSAYYDMRLRLKPSFKVNEYLTLNLQLDALEKTWGQPDDDFSGTSAKENDAANIDFDAAYMIIKSPIGGFVVGRYATSLFGTGLADSAAFEDRIMYILPIKDWTFVTFMQKSGEYDKGEYVADADNHKYATVAVYKGEKFTAGGLIAVYDYRTFVSPEQLDDYVFAGPVTMGGAGAAIPGLEAAVSGSQATAAGALAAAAGSLATAAGANAALAADPTNSTLISNAAAAQAAADGAQAAADGAVALAAVDLATLTGTQAAYDGAAAIYANGPPTYEVMAYVPELFFKGKFGPVGIEAEIDYAIGKGENASDGREDIDAKMMEYLAEVSFDAGPAILRGGYVYMSGDDDPYDDELTCFAYVEASEDLDKAFILTGGDGNARDGAGLEKTLGGAGIPDSLGGYGTVAAGIVSPFTNVAVRAGIKMLYAGVSFKPRENLNIDLLYAYAKADEVWDTNGYLSALMGAAQGPVDDVMGSEYDLTVTWDIFDNLEYKFVAAYLQAGDFWKQGFDVEIDDTYTLFNKLTLSF